MAAGERLEASTRQMETALRHAEQRRMEEVMRLEVQLAAAEMPMPLSSEGLAASALTSLSAAAEEEGRVTMAADETRVGGAGRGVPSAPSSRGSSSHSSGLYEMSGTLIGGGSEGSSAPALSGMEKGGDAAQGSLLSLSGAARTNQLMIENYHRMMLAAKQNCSDELGAMRAKHAADRDALEKAHEARLEGVRADAAAEAEAAAARQEELAAANGALRAEQAAAVERHADALAKENAQAESALQTVRGAHASALASLREDHEAALEAARSDGEYEAYR